jgi:hypothetical protein
MTPREFVDPLQCSICQEPLTPQQSIGTGTDTHGTFTIWLHACPGNHPGGEPASTHNVLVRP